MDCGFLKTNIEIFTSEAARIPFLVRTHDDAIVNIEGWAFRMMIRGDLADTGPAEVSVQSGDFTAENSTISIIDAENGAFEIYISNADLRAGLSVPPGERAGIYVYDLLVSDINGDSKVMMAGQFIFIDAVTE